VQYAACVGIHAPSAHTKHGAMFSCHMGKVLTFTDARYLSNKMNGLWRRDGDYNSFVELEGDR
jgi:hypothetical protein